MATTTFLNGFGHVRPESDRFAVFVHGAGMDSTIWTMQARYLAGRGMPVVAPDLPGHGQSGGEALQDVESMARWLQGFVQTLGIAHCVLIGHSMGALIAARAASLLGEQCSGLALLGAAREMPVHPDLILAATEDLPSAAALIGDWAYAGGTEMTPQSVPGSSLVWQARRLLEASAPGVLATDLKACAAFEFDDRWLEKMNCHSLVIVGKRDRMTPAKKGRVFANSLAADYIELEHSGHMMMVEEPAKVRKILANRLTDWLARAD